MDAEPEFDHPAGPPSRLAWPDLLHEALAGIALRPWRSVAAMTGTALGVGTLVAVLALTATADGQLVGYDPARATTVTVTDHPATDGVPPGTDPPTGFPPDADARAERITGVTAAGVWWRLPAGRARVAAAPTADPPSGPGLPVYAATPGAVAAMQLTLATGVTLDPYPAESRLPVALLGRTAAARLGVEQPTERSVIYLDGVPYTVLGVYRGAARLPEALDGVIVPGTTALDHYGNPGTGEYAARLLAATRPGAAPVVARQLPVALRPDAPDRFTVTTPADPDRPREHRARDLTAGPAGLFLTLAVVFLLIGAIGITGSLLISVGERGAEIGLRRTLGAWTRHIVEQFLAEAAALGTLGGLVGTAVAVLVVLCVALARGWTAVLQPALVLPAPLLGTALGLLAGAHPAARAAR